MKCWEFVRDFLRDKSGAMKVYILTTTKPEFRSKPLSTELMEVDPQDKQLITRVPIVGNEPLGTGNENLNVTPGIAVKSPQVFNKPGTTVKNSNLTPVFNKPGNDLQKSNVTPDTDSVLPHVFTKPAPTNLKGNFGKVNLLTPNSNAPADKNSKDQSLENPAYIQKFKENDSRSNQIRSNFSNIALSTDNLQMASTFTSKLQPRKICQDFEELRIHVPVVDDVEDEISTETKIGEGSQGAVWKGKWLRTTVAIQKISRIDGHQGMTFREMRLLDKVRHPNIIALMAVGREITNYLIVTEYYESKSLFHALFNKAVRDSYKLNYQQKLHIEIQLCQALYYLHNFKHKIVHRDVKPDNVLVAWTPEERYLYDIKLCDLGTSTCKEMVSQF